LQDEPEGWPKHLDLDGFGYERLGGYGADPEAAIGQRGSKWFVDWLARDRPYTPQPYQQAVKVLRAMGHPEIADDVLYAGRERERNEAWQRGDYPRWFWLSLLSWTIGYGIGLRYFRALWWVVGLVLAATIVLRVTGQSTAHRWGEERGLGSGTASTCCSRSSSCGKPTTTETSKASPGTGSIFTN
jgi:hypothetical protein